MFEPKIPRIREAEGYGIKCIQTLPGSWELGSVIVKALRDRHKSSQPLSISEVSFLSILGGR
ncbi:hypothetical protein CC2G_004370 [Coprinopsis cinerea AmutBmut pab1-1]|nr:hypothetical protein CC2G_004370 [Coprinopsis cinerea AmutBmut pab1-1]